MPRKKPKGKSPAVKLLDLLAKTYYLAGLIAGIFAAATFASGNRLVSYVFIAITCASVDVLLWRSIRARVLAILAVFTATLVPMMWVGLNMWTDYQKARGILFSPARRGELLLVVAHFDQRGGSGIDPTTRIVDHLKSELKTAKLPDIRIEIVPKIGDSDEAQRIGQVHRADVVIWGWYDSLGVRTHVAFVEPDQPRQRILPGERVPAFSSFDLPEIPRELSHFNPFVREMLPEELTFFSTSVIGSLYYVAGKYNQAIRAIDVSLANLARNDRILGVCCEDVTSFLYFYRGASQFWSGHPEEATVDFTRAIKLNPGSASAYYYRGVAYIFKHAFDLAAADFSKVIEIDPRFSKAYTFRAGTRYIQRDFDLAIVDTTKAIEIDPKIPDAYNVRGLAYDAKGNVAQALVDYTRAIELGFNSYSVRCALHSRRNEPVEVIADCTKAIAINPKDADAYTLRGLAYHQRGQLDRTIFDQTRAIELGGGTSLAAAYTSRALAYSDKGEGTVDQIYLNNAIADYSRAIELDPNIAFSYYGRGRVYSLKGLPLRAVTDFESYLRREPSGPFHTEVEGWLRSLKAH